MSGISDLARFATEARDERKGRGVYPASAGKSLACFDQTLGSTGLVSVIVAQDGTVKIETAQTFKPPALPQYAGHELNLARARVLKQALWSQVGWLHLMLSPVSEGEGVVVLEQPPVSGGRMSRPESSLLAAYVVTEVAMHHGGHYAMVSAQRAKALVCGNRNAKKPEAHQALKVKYGHLPGFDLVTNEHERDALMLALSYLTDQESKSG